VQRGENWARSLYLRITRSPLWPRLAVFLTYDEGGGFADHVPPPEACPPSADRDELDRRGTRVPLIVVSPWARGHHVSHEVADHASLLRFIELLHDLPALSDRDANAGALLDMFDFAEPRLRHPPPPARAGRGGCRKIDLASQPETARD
jgi:phospholipase C